MDYEDIVEKLKGGDNFSIVKLDVLRVLADNFGKRWESELLQDLNLFRDYVGRSKVSEDDLEEALEELGGEDLIDMDDRPRATREGGEPDSLVSLLNFEEAERVFSEDEALLEYRKSRR